MQAQDKGIIPTMCKRVNRGFITSIFIFLFITLLLPTCEAVGKVPSAYGRPYSFFVVHCEQNDATPEDFEALKHLVQLANSYKVKLSIYFNPQWVDMILADSTMTEEVHSWQSEGHEVGLHHHGPRHQGWNGYTNMPEQEALEIRQYLFELTGNTEYLEGEYLGTVDSYMPKFNQLVYPYIIKSGTVTDKWTDMPIEVQYDVDGYTEGRTGLTTTNIWNRHLTYRLNIFLAGSFSETEYQTAVDQYNSLGPKEVYGVVVHVYNFKYDMTGVKQWFKFLYAKDLLGLKRKTVVWIMEKHVLPNNFISIERCSNSVCDSEEREINSCPVDCAECGDFIRRDCETATIYIENK